MTDAVAGDPSTVPEANTSTRHGEVPTNPFMAALHRAPDEVGRRRNWLLGQPDELTPTHVPEPAALVDEIAELRTKLAAAEERAAEAENALPHLMGLGQRTVDGLLNDARRRGREIIEAARVRADEEFSARRQEMQSEGRELDALRMAVAAEAMGLELIRSELQRRITLSAAELSRMAEHPMLLGGELPLEQAGLPSGAEAPAELPAVEPLPVLEVDGLAPEVLAESPVGLVEASLSSSDSEQAQIEIAAAVSCDATALHAPGDPVDDDEATALHIGAAERDEIHGAAPIVVAATAADAGGPDAEVSQEGSRFAAAWEAEEDEGVAEAFDRFFSADVEYEPSREWILADDTRA